MNILKQRQQQQQQQQQQQRYNELYRSYQQEILYLRKSGSKLLQQIKHQEIKINKRRQKRLKPLSRQVNLLHRLIKKLIKTSAFIYTYKYFQMIQRPLTYNNAITFYRMVGDNYKKELEEIVLKIKRINRK